MAERYVRIGQYPDYRDEVRGTLAEILASTANPGTYAAPEDVTGTFLEMGTDGKWDGASVGTMSKATADALYASGALANLATGATYRDTSGTQYSYGGAGAGWRGNQVPLLVPTGNDQTAEIQQFLDDYRNSASALQFGAGDFVINGQLVFSGGRVVSPENGMQFGQHIFGSGPEITRLLDMRADKSEPMIRITRLPTAPVTSRYEMSRIGGFTLAACDNRSDVITFNNPPDGVGIFASAVVGTGYGAFVYHSNRMERIKFIGHEYPLTLDDTTQFFGEELRFSHAKVGIRTGGNCDIIKIKNCSFGSEAGMGFNNDMIGVKTGYDFGVLPPGLGNILEFNGCWFMSIGTALEDSGSSQVSFRDSYFERCRRYFYNNSITDGRVDLQMDSCVFSFYDDQLTEASNDPTSPNYVAHIQYGATGIPDTTRGPQGNVTVKNCYAYTDTTTPPNAFISFNREFPGYVDWANNNIGPSASFGHVRNTKYGYKNWKTIPLKQGNVSMSVRIGGVTGMARLSGEEIIKDTTAIVGTTFINPLVADYHQITLPDGDCTLAIQYWDTTPPSVSVDRGTEITLHLIAPGTITGTRTITLKDMRGLTTLTITASDANKVCIIKLRAMAENKNTMQVMNSPAFYDA